MVWLTTLILILAAPASAAPAPPAPAATGLKVTETVLAPAPQGEIFVSPDGMHWAAVRERDNRFVVVVDGREGKPYHWIAQQRVAFTADCALAVYIARDVHKAFLVTNTTEGRRHEAIDHFVTSASGRRIAYAAVRGDRMVAVVDGAESAQYTAVRFDEVSEKLAPFIATTARGECVVTGTTATPLHDEVTAVWLAPDGRRMAYRARQGNRWLLIDGQHQHPCDETTAPVFSPDSKHLAWVMRQAADDVLLLDGQAIARHAQIQRDVAFSPDGRQLAYVTADAAGKCALFTWSDGRADKAGDPFDAIEAPRFSPDSKRLAFVARHAGGDVLVVDGAQGPAFDSLTGATLTWSPDGRHVACLARRNDRPLLAIDAAETPAYDRIIVPSRIAFDSPRSLHFLAVRDKQLLRVRVELPPA